MMPLGFWKLLYLLSTFSLAACVMSSHWIVLAARRVDDWGRRFTLFEATRRVSLRFGLASILMIALCANLTRLSLGSRRPWDGWLLWTDALCLIALAVLALVELPAARALAHEARRAIHQGPSGSFDRALGRWRLGNATLLVLSVASIGMLVLRWWN
jgi:hypothetical protein